VQTPTSITLVPATPDQAADLCALTYRAKASHGYDEAFMQLLRTDIQISDEQIAHDQIMLAISDNQILGFAHLMAHHRPDTLLLENLYVEPSAQGRGIGRRLFVWARITAAEQGYAWLEWESDPNAAAFYLRMGGEKIGETESPIRAGRMIPRFRIATTPTAGPSPMSKPNQRIG
jgi:GNAT superfamily N-acetyltransferase